jgi:hypothetical protein
MERSFARLMTLAVLSLCLTSCNPTSLQYKNDHRLSFRAPRSRQLVMAPVHVAWTMKAFEAVGLDGSSDTSRGAYGVFIDRAPLPAGKDLRWIARDDAGCKRDLQCPTARFLADRGVFVTTATSLDLTSLPPASEGVGDEQHYVTVVLLNGKGRRIGESAWYLPFSSKREKT